MERFSVTMNEADIDLFERRRGELEMTKSAFVRYLLMVNENKEPVFLKYKDLIGNLASINTCLGEILTNENIDANDKLYINEKVKEVRKIIKEYFL